MEQVIKRFIIKFTLIFFAFPTMVLAAWEVAKPEAAIPRQPFFQAGTEQSTAFSPYGARAFPNRFSSFGAPAARYAISVSGSLKENIERIMGRYHWKVVWSVPYDYNFDGRITGSSLPNVIEKLLKPFPLQAVLYMSNRVMEVKSRNP